MEFKGQLLWRNHKYRDRRKQTGRQSWENRHKHRQTTTHTDHDFVLSGEVGWLTQQLTLGHSDRAGSLSDQHSVVKPHPSRRRGNQVSALWAREDGQQGAKLGDKKLRHTSTWPNEDQTILPTHKDQYVPLNTRKITSLGLGTAAAKCDSILRSNKAIYFTVVLSGNSWQSRQKNI